MPDRVESAAKSGKVAELLKAITAGREPPPTEEEWGSLRDFWQGKLGRRRRGHHKSVKRERQGLSRQMLRGMMETLKAHVRNDPAERELKRTMRANGETYILNRRVALNMQKRLIGWREDALAYTGAPVPDVPTIEYLVNVLDRVADEDPPFGLKWFPPGLDFFELD